MEEMVDVATMTTSLPLDWTRLSRSDDCPDVLCSGCLPNSVVDDVSLRPIAGSAMLCLPDSENDWFQGYFVVAGSNETFKLLCIQQDNADPCLQCDDYQLWTVTLYHPNTNDAVIPKKQDFCNVISRGGDSVCWHHENIRFRADTVHTGTKSYRFVERYFGGLLERLRDNASDTVETIMPNVAIVTGDMKIWIKE